MKKEKTNYPISTDLSYDYKLEWSVQEDQKNWESLEKWLYLGADFKNRGFAKIGITMGDLSTRSYSSANPNYYIFCGFKCRYNISKEKLKCIENDILRKFTNFYIDENGDTKRLVHIDSGRLSECFDNVNFIHFLAHLHYELFHNHNSSFITGVFCDESDEEFGDILDIEFNKKFVTESEQSMYRLKLAQ